MKPVLDTLLDFISAAIISFFVTVGAMGWFLVFKIHHIWLASLAIIPAFVFLEWYFDKWAKKRFDMYVETNGKTKTIYVRIAGENFIVQPGQEMVIRQSSIEPGKVEVFTGEAI